MTNTSDETSFNCSTTGMEKSTGQETEPLADPIIQAMERMGIHVTKDWLDTISGTESSKPALLETASTVRGMILDVDPKWRARILKLDESHHPLIVRLGQAAEWFIKHASFNDSSKGRQLVICGSPGTGKSHAGKRIVAFFQSYSIDLWHDRKWGHPPKAVFVDWARLCERDREEAFDEAQREISEADVIVLDDVGSESDKFKSQQSVSRLRRVLGTCEHKWVMVNANFSKAEWPRKFDARVADRLEAMHYLDLTGVPSYRPKLRKD